MPAAQQQELNASSAEGHLHLRVHPQSTQIPVETEFPVHPESRHWFAHVENSAPAYVAQLGYYDTNQTWVPVTTSAPSAMPPGVPVEPAEVTFAVFDSGCEAERLTEEPLLLDASAQEQHDQACQISPAQPQPDATLHRTTVAQEVPAAELRSPLDPTLPAIKLVAPTGWTPAHDLALEEVITTALKGAVTRAGSLEFSEVIQEQPGQAVSSLLLAVPPLQPGEAEKVGLGPVDVVSSVELAGKGPSERPRAFWFKVNAELIVYGATEPTAKVAVGKRPLSLRPDGSFSFRFSLPDGRYQLPVTATSTDGEQRTATMNFVRETGYTGTVGKVPQDESLKTPTPEHAAP
jgi:hypothetical protein